MTNEILSGIIAAIIAILGFLGKSQFNSILSAIQNLDKKIIELNEISIINKFNIVNMKKEIDEIVPVVYALEKRVTIIETEHKDQMSRNHRSAS